MFMDEIDMIARGTELARSAKRVNNGFTRSQRIEKEAENPTAYRRHANPAIDASTGLPWWENGERGRKKRAAKESPEAVKE